MRAAPPTLDSQKTMTVFEQEQLASALLAAIVESSDDAIIGKDLNSIITSWNRGAEKIFGYTASEMIGTSILRLIPEDRKDEEAHIMGQIRQGQKVNHFETLRQTKDGRLITVSVTVSPIRDIEGNIIGASKIARDITVQKEHECELARISRLYASRQSEIVAQNEQRFSATMIESMPGVLYFYDESGRFLRWNRNFETVSGYSGEEIARMHPLDFFVGAEKELLKERIAEVFEKGNAFIEANFRAKDGTSKPLLFTGRRIEFNGQRCLIGMGVDISERKRAEELLRASEGRYRTLFEHAPDGIVIANAEAYYVDANASICRMLGYTREELVGLHSSDIVVPEEISCIATALSAINSQPDYHREWQFRRKDGSIFPAEVIATTMPDGNILALIRDITDRKQVEKDLYALNDNLEQQVAVRTEELQSALVRAEAADRIKSAFLATMSHELRTPLNSIIGFTGLVIQGLAGPLNAEQSKQLGMVRSSAHHLLDLINDVLDISKIEAGQLEVRTERFQLLDSLTHVAALVRPLAEKKGLELTIIAPPELEEVVSDKRRVEQILINLITNAIKFTEQGHVTVTTELVSGHESKGEPCPVLSLRVEDTGIGITPEDLATLFQPFRQVDSGLTRQHEGTGLGLAICRRLATLLGGEISAMSEFGKGSAFTVTIPLHPPTRP